MRRCKTILSVLLVLSFVVSIPMNTYASEDVEIPEPIKVVEFSKSFDELAESDNKFNVIDNAAKPELVFDKEMGQVLKLGKAVIKDREFYEKEDGRTTAYIISDNSDYSIINISNPYAGVEHLVEYEPYEDVETTMYGNNEQPLWKEGITISYWIKTPSAENGYGINSNVLGFTSERFQIQADDYAKHLCTVKFDLEYKTLTDEERAALGPEVERCGVLPGSDFYFELASDELYEGCPIYKDPSGTRMGRTYWMNKFYVDGYLQLNDGSIVEAAKGHKARYADYNVAPELGNTSEEHKPGTSNLRYAWTYSEMWLDASSSFYFTNDEEMDIQLNPNVKEDYGKTMGMQHNNSFNINSWSCVEDCYMSYSEADKYGVAAESPVINPDKWHYVTIVIQNDWVKYYFDGKEIDVENEYSSFGTSSLCHAHPSVKPWKRFNKSAGSRYGYGTINRNTYSCYYGNYCSPTIMEWITMDCVNLTIGGGNRNGDGYFMYADTDEIMLKNIVFYDTMLTDEQIKELAKDPTYYEDPEARRTADVNNDGKITSKDALLILKHSAHLELLDNPLTYDVTRNNLTDSEDALIVLKFSAGIIDSFY